MCYDYCAHIPLGGNVYWNNKQSRAGSNERIPHSPPLSLEHVVMSKVTNDRWKEGFRWFWLLIWYKICKYYELRPQYRSLQKHWLESDAVLPWVSASQTSLFIHVLWRGVVAKKLCERRLLLPAFWKYPDSSEYPHSSVLKIKHKTFEAPVVKETPSQMQSPITWSRLPDHFYSF